MELIQDKNSRAGVIGTILFHMLLLLLFLRFGMSYQDPPPENPGSMMINFGDAGGGSDSNEPTDESESSAASASNNSATTENNSSTPENAMTQDHTETVDLNASQNNNTSETQETVDENLTEALNALQNANNSNNSSNNNNSNNSSTNNTTGNTHGHNTGPSSGIGFDLGGRGEVSFKKPDNPTQEDGKVVVEIVVDREGNVVKAKAGARGSTTTNPILEKKAEEAALKAKFTKNMEAPAEQKGTMTFVFILN